MNIGFHCLAFRWSGALEHHAPGPHPPASSIRPRPASASPGESSIILDCPVTDKVGSSRTDARAGTKAAIDQAIKLFACYRRSRTPQRGRGAPAEQGDREGGE